jgi:hypothetical protein
LVFATFSGLLGLAFSIIIRIELAAPGAQLLSGHNQLFNAVITAHGLLIVFFLVMIFSLFNILNTSKFNKYIIIIYFHFLGNKIFLRKLNSLSKNKNNKPPYDFTKIEIENCFINRKIIAINAKKAVGVYVFKSENGSCYVGSSISLYNRVCSYFIPSILAKGDRRVLRFFHKYSFKNVHLTLYIINESATAVQAIELEQYFIDTLSPDLNVDLIASSSGYHEPISIKWRIYLRELRGTPVYVYDLATNSLVHLFDSKTHLCKVLKFDFKALTHKFLDTNKKFLGRYIFSTIIIPEINVDSILTENDLQLNFKETRADFDRVDRQIDRNKAVFCENTLNQNLSISFRSLNEASRGLKGDRITIREYLNGKRMGLYRKVWKLSWINEKDKA